MPTLEELKARGFELLDILVEWATSPQFYAQIGAALAALVVAWLASGQIRKRVTLLRDEPVPGPFLKPRQIVHACRNLVFPVLLVFALSIAIKISESAVGQAWLVRGAQGAAVVFVLYTAINRFITHPLVRLAAIWIAIPLATLQVFGLFDETVTALDNVSLEIGNIRLSLYFLAKAAIAGGIMFWLGRVSSNAGQAAIRKQDALDISTRELFAKLFEIGLFFILFIVLLQLLGLDLTALTVFGGALGIGLGFGLQQIASNFISGMIILLDRSIGIGDYIELEDGRSGILRELKMRSATLETFDGKDIVVPNEKFITTSFVNWTHKDKRQRYDLKFQVAYDTDLEPMFDLIRETVSSHPQVLSGNHIPHEMLPDAEIDNFGDSGIDILVEFWMEGIDDGPNRVAADLRLMIWQALKAKGIEIPFPQREVKILEKPKPG